MDEVGSDDFDAFLGRRPRALISRLGMVELRCLLKPRCRTQEIDVSYERATLADFADDVRRGHFQVEPLTDQHALMAYDLMGSFLANPCVPSMPCISRSRKALASERWRPRISVWREPPKPSASA